MEENVSELDQRIREWLSTPKGIMTDNPAWGHALGQFKGEPAGEDLNGVIKMSIVEKMPGDIPGVDIKGILVESAGDDKFKVVIIRKDGAVQAEVTL